jgi:hypothetical protein
MRKEVGHDISALREETEAIKDASTDMTARINQVEQVFLFVGFVEVDIALQKMSMGDKVNDSCIPSTNFAQQPESELSPDQCVQSTKQLTSVGAESTCIEMAGGDGQQQTAFNRRMAKLVNSRLRIVDDSLKKKAERREKMMAWFSSKFDGLT